MPETNAPTFPCSELSPTPSDIRRSINYPSSNSPGDVRAFWIRQMGHSLLPQIEGREVRSRDGYALTPPPDLSKFHRRYPLGVWAAIMQFCGLGGARRIGQVIYGFPITGTLSRKYAFRPTTDRLPAQFPLTAMIPSASSRFTRRSTRPPPMADALRGEAMDQVDQGRLDPPRLLSAPDCIEDSPRLRSILRLDFPSLKTPKYERAMA